MMYIAHEAKFKQRVIATIVDYGVILTFWLIYSNYVLGVPFDGRYHSITGTEAFPVVLAWWIYFPFIESRTGQTLGYLVNGIKVVNLAGKSISFRQSLLRRVVDPLDLFAFLGLVSYLAIRYTEKHQRIGDLIARTLVVADNLSTCQQCREQMILSPIHKIRGQYKCKFCGSLNKI